MTEPSRTNHELIEENSFLKQRIQELEHSEAEHKRVEEELRKSQEQLRDAHRLAHIGVWNWMADTDTVTWSEELYRIAGLDPMMPAPTYAEHTNIYAAESWDRLKASVEKTLETGASYQLELELIHSGGTTRNVNAFGGTIFDNNGRVTGLHGTVQDITERKRFEEVQAFLAQTSSGTLEEPFFEALARNLAQSLGMDYVCIDRLEGDELTARTVAVWCDGHFEDNVTYALKDTPCGDVVGQTVCCFPASVCQFFPRDRALQDLKAESYIGATLFDHTGRPIGLIAVIGRKPLANRPLAETILKMVAVRAAGEMERLDAEEALKNTNAYLENLINYANAPIIVWDPQFRITRFNHAFEFLTGRSEADVLGKSLELLFPSALTEDSMALIRKTMTGERWETVEIKISHCDESVHTVLWNSATLFAPDAQTPVATIAQGHEITKRKLAEETLEEERRRLQQALDEVRTLRGIMPICAYCKKIRDDEGYWNQVEKYVSDHTDAKFSHGICPTCFEREMKGISGET